MDPFTISLGASLLSAGASWWNRQEQAGQLRRENAEQLRRFGLEADRRVGYARAAGAASGVEFESSSLQDFITEMRAELDRQASFMRRAGARSASAISTAGTVGLVGDVAGSLFQYGQNNNWWRR